MVEWPIGTKLSWNHRKFSGKQMAILKTQYPDPVEVTSKHEFERSPVPAGPIWAVWVHFVAADGTPGKTHPSNLNAEVSALVS